MKILIIGGTSAIGIALKKALIDFSQVMTAGRVNCDFHLDLDDQIENIIIPNGFDVVIHTAANFGGKLTHEILAAENINVLGTLKLCEAALKANTKHFILISSISTELNENDEYYSIYSLSKKHSEDIARYYSLKLGLPLTILKPSQVYGNEECFRKHQPFIYTIADKAQNNKDIEIYGNNDASRNFIHIEDLTQIIIRVIQYKIHGTFQCTQTVDVTFSQIAKTALKAFNSKGKIRFISDKPDIPDNIFKKDNSLYDKIKFYPQISIEDGMKKMELYRRNMP